MDDLTLEDALHELQQRERLASSLVSRTAGSMASPSGSTIDIDALIKGEGADKRADLVRALYAQESGSGAANTAQPNYAGARGPMQVTQPTFDDMKARGLIPADWQWGNQEQSARAGIRLVNSLADRYGDDARKVAAAYYSGPKAVGADGAIKDFRDPLNDKAPTTLQYVDQVTGRVKSAKPQEAKTPPKWSQIEDDKDYQALSSEEREQVRRAYFENVVMPETPTEALSGVKKAFDDNTAPTIWRTVGKAAAKATASVLERAGLTLPTEGAQLTDKQRAELSPDLRAAYDARQRRAAAGAVSRDWGEVAADTGVAVAQGVVGLASLPSTFYGLATKDMDNPVSKFFQGGLDAGDESKSDKMKAEQSALQADIEAAEGWREKFGVAFASFARSPAMALDQMARMIPSLAAGGVVGTAVAPTVQRTAQAAAMATAVRAASTDSAALARGAVAISKAAEPVARQAGAFGVAASVQGQDTALDTYRDAVKIDHKQWQDDPGYVRLIAAGMGPDEARQQRAAEMAAAAGAQAFMISMGSMALPGGGRIETMFKKGGGKAAGSTAEGRVMSAIKAGAGEMVSEGIEEGGSAAAGAAQLAKIDPSTDIAGRAAAAAGQGAAAALPMGMAAGVIHGDHAAHPMTPLPAGDVLAPADLEARAVGLEQTAQRLRIGAPVSPATWEVVDGAPVLSSPTSGSPGPAATPLQPAGSPALPPPGGQTIMVDSAGNAAPMPSVVRTAAQNAAVEAEIARDLERSQERGGFQARRAADAELGLTPDVRAAQARDPRFTPAENPDAGRTDTPTGAAGEATQPLPQLQRSGDRGGAGPTEQQGSDVRGAATGRAANEDGRLLAGATVQSQGPAYGKTRTTATSMGVAPGAASPEGVQAVPPETLQRVREAADKFRAALPADKALKVRVVESAPEEGDPEGWYDREAGEVVLNAGRILRGEVPARRLAEVYLHEVVGHHGVESVVDPREFDSLVRDTHRVLAAQGGSAGMAQRGHVGSNGLVRIGSPDYVTVDAVRLEYPNASDTEIALETIARAAEMGVKPGLVKRLVSTIRRGLRAVGRRMGIDVSWTDGDIMDLVRRAGHAVQKGQSKLLPKDQAKAITGRVDGTGIMRSQGAAEHGVWRSALADAVAEAKTPQRPAADWLSWINSLTQKGVKREEIEWSGVTDWLRMQSGKVTKEELQAFLGERGLKIEETVLGDTAGWTEADTHRLDDLEERHDTLTAAEESERQALISRENAATPDNEGAPKVTRYGSYTLPGGENYRELLLRLPERADAQSDYSSAHWDETNILAHIRFNERQDEDGGRVLFLEELQSDWAQEGRRGGFNKKEPSPRGWANVNNPRSTGVVPPGPFVTKTESWVALALKRAIAWAAENGFDKVAFTSGDQNVERYSKGAGINGEGMHAFYDKIVPSVTKDVLRKLGGGGMKRVRLVDPTATIRNDSLGHAGAIGAITQPGFDITPGLIASAERGIPMFSRGGAERDGKPKDDKPSGSQPNSGKDAGKFKSDKGKEETWLSPKDMALLQREMDAEQGRDQQEIDMTQAREAGRAFEAVTPDKVSALGLYVEDAFPRLEYGEPYRDEQTGYDFSDANIAIGGSMHTAQVATMDEEKKRFAAFPPELHGAGKALSWFGLSEAQAKAYNRRVIASIELGRRRFDLLAAVPQKSVRNIVRVWRRVSQIPGAFEFAAKVNPPKEPGSSKERMQSIADSLLAGSGQRIKVFTPVPENPRFYPVIVTDKGGKPQEAELEFVGNTGGAKGGRFVVHAVDLERGSGAGKALYQFAQAVADFYGAKITADPVGLLGVNTYRRTEQMFSGAARLGATGPMQPGVGQRIYGWEIGTKTAKQADDNFARLALAIQRNVGEFVPEFRVGDITYDLANDRFMRRGQDVEELIGEILARPDVRAASLSRSTLARAAITASAVQGSDPTRHAETSKKPVLYSRGGAQRAGREYTSGPLDWLLKKGGGTMVRDWITSPVLDRLTGKLASIVPERAKMGAQADYGLDERYLDRKIDKGTAINKQVREAKHVIDGLADLDRAGSRVAYNWMNEKPDTELERQLMDRLPEAMRARMREMKAMVDALGRAAVDVGLLSEDSYARNRMAYLHRSYATHEKVIGGAASRSRASTIRAETYKGRGIREDVGDDALVQDIDEIGQGDKLLRIERLGVNGQVTARRYIKPDDPVPTGWMPEHVWEARFFDKKSLVGLWRDLTPEERQRLGEIDEVRFAFAKTVLAAVRDIENARFLKWVADNYASADVPPEKLVQANENFLTVQTYAKDEWIEVPVTKIAGTGIHKYGALAGKTIPAVMWNDIRNRMALPESELGKLYQDVLKFWKVSKTALSPAVHMNNVMSNFIFADLADVGAHDVAKSLRLLLKVKRGDAAATRIWERYQDSGSEHGSFAAYELNEQVIEPLLRELENAQADELGSLRLSQIVSLVAHGQVGEALKALGTKKAVRGAAIPFKLMLAAYQAEDGVFRLAKWMKDVEHGASDREAGKAARDAFLNYDINAPWIQTMRRSALPFIAFSYRAIPKLLEAVRDKPWKVAKYYAVFSALNAMGYALLGSAGDEDKERKLLAPELQGKMLGIFPRMLRMPWNDQHGSPVFLDVRRWIPAGDVFDLNGSHAATPVPSWLTWGGPLQVFANLMANKDSFTGREIVKDTDTPGEVAAKLADYLFKSAAPNLPLPGPGYIVPGTDTGQLQTYSWTGIINAGTGRTDAFGRESDVGSAVMSSLGVKLRSYPEDAGKLAVMQRFEKAQREIDQQINADQRELARKGITREEFDKRLVRNQEKLQKAQQQAEQALK